MDAIDPNKPIHPATHSKTENDRQKTGRSSFDAVLKQQLGTDRLAPSAPQSLPLTAEIRPAQFTDEPQFSKHAVVDQLQHLVATMTAYQNKLDQTKTSLKEVAPLVDQMDSQSQLLTELSGSGGEQDGHLQELIDQSLMISTLEISKFRSGYYNHG